MSLPGGASSRHAQHTWRCSHCHCRDTSTARHSMARHGRCIGEVLCNLKSPQLPKAVDLYQQEHSLTPWTVPAAARGEETVPYQPAFLSALGAADVRCSYRHYCRCCCCCPDSHHSCCILPDNALRCCCCCYCCYCCCCCCCCPANQHPSRSPQKEQCTPTRTAAPLQPAATKPATTPNNSHPDVGLAGTPSSSTP